MKQPIPVLRWGYVTAVHALLIVMILKTDFIELVQRGFGTWTPTEMDRTWQDAVAIHRRIDEQLPPGVVLFIGDSLILGLEVGGFSRRAANYGIGFDTTAGVLHRLDFYRSTRTASAVVLLIGTNDLMYRDVAAIGQNHQIILSRLSGVRRIVAIGLLPVDERIWGEQRNTTHRTINQAMSRMCEAQSNCRYVDAWPMLTEGGGLLSSYHSGDGLHLNRAAYERLTSAIAPALEP